MLRRRALYKKKGIQYAFSGQGEAFVKFTSFPLFFEDFSLNWNITVEFNVPDKTQVDPINERIFGNSISGSRRSCFCFIKNDNGIAFLANYADRKFDFFEVDGYVEGVAVKYRFEKIGSVMNVYKDDAFLLTENFEALTADSVQFPTMYINSADESPSRPGHVITSIFKWDQLDAGGIFQSNIIDANLNQQTGLNVPNSGSASDGSVENSGGLVLNSWWVPIS